MNESGKNPEHFACSVKHLSEALETDLILTPAGAEPPGPHLYEDDSSISQTGSVLLLLRLLYWDLMSSHQRSVFLKLSSLW